MKVYLDGEMPKSCRECFCNVEDTWCALSDGEMGDICEECDNKTRHKKCPLKTLADYTKQVRKEVCEDIISKGKIKYGYSPSHKDGIKQVLEIDKEVLDQIQGETK